MRPLARQDKSSTLAATPPNKTCDTPAFVQLWLCTTPVKRKPEWVRAMDTDRWPVGARAKNFLPLSAKSMVGVYRQVVHTSERVQGLPELALLAGSLLQFRAATFLAPPTGFWDRKPQRTLGCLRRPWIGQPFPKDVQLPGQLRETTSVTGQLPKGTQARHAQTWPQRRQ